MPVIYKSPEIIQVYHKDNLLGRIGLNKEHLAVFEYEAEFIGNGFSISPFYLPLVSGVFKSKRDPFNGLFGVFNDSLPDSWGNLLLDRYLKSIGWDINKMTILDRLSIIGDSGMGSLTYKPEFKPTSIKTANKSILEYADEVKKILGEKEYQENIEELYRYGGSSGGARPKVMLQIEGESWIIKFPSPLDHAEIGVQEYEYAQVALGCGIKMPETRLFDHKYFGVKRFDRENTRKIHMHSAAGLLYADYRYPSLDYKDLLVATFALTRNMEDVWRLYRQMAFNVFTGNKDDHAKNFSFLYKQGHWSLSPAYDLVQNVGFNAQHTTTINGVGNPEIADMLEVADQVNISKKKAKEIIEEVYENSKSIHIEKFN